MVPKYTFHGRTANDTFSGCPYLEERCPAISVPHLNTSARGAGCQPVPGQSYDIGFPAPNMTRDKGLFQQLHRALAAQSREENKHEVLVVTLVPQLFVSQ